MEVKINILANKNTLTVQDNTKYLTEGYSYFNYKPEDCRSIILIESHESKLTDEEIPKFLTGGFGKQIDIQTDGYITVHYIVLPTKEWVFKPESQNIINQQSKKYIYYVDKEKIIDYESQKSISFEELLNFCYSDNINSRIFRTHQEYVNILNLYNCYINLCQQLLSQRGFSNCQAKNKIDSELVYKRDLVWMTINVINYLVERHTENNHTLGEAQRIIEMIHSCNGICKETNNLNQTIKHGCGCSKR